MAHVGQRIDDAWQPLVLVGWQHERVRVRVRIRVKVRVRV